MTERLRVSPREPEKQTCPLCKDTLFSPTALVATCGGCETRYHSHCLDELGGCSTLGCRKLTPVRAEPQGRSTDAATRRGVLAVVFALLSFMGILGFLMVFKAREAKRARIEASRAQTHELAAQRRAAQRATAAQDVPGTPRLETMLAEQMAESLSEVAKRLRLQPAVSSVDAPVFQQDGVLLRGSLRFTTQTYEYEVHFVGEATAAAGHWAFANGRKRAPGDRFWDAVERAPRVLEHALGDPRFR